MRQQINGSNCVVAFLLLFTIITGSLINAIIGQEFGFEEEYKDDDNKKNPENKKPIFLPSKCAKNELFYPGDRAGDWVCDCKPGSVYYPPEDGCYNAYQQGPCPENHYLVLPPKQNIPECRRNKCGNGRVRFQKSCYTLHEAGPCPLPELSYVVGVNVTTLRLDCIQESIHVISRFGEDDDQQQQQQQQQQKSDELYETTYKCLKGGRRWINNKCSNVTVVTQSTD